MTAPTATPASHDCIELLRVNSQALLHLLAPEQLDRLTKGQIGSVLHILGVTAQASLRLSEAAHLDATTRNHLASGEKRADLEVDGKQAAIAAEMGRIKAKVDKVAAGTESVKAEMERVKAKVDEVAAGTESVKAEMERIKAKVDEVAAETESVKAEMERMRTEALKGEGFEAWGAEIFL